MRLAVGKGLPALGESSFGAWARGGGILGFGQAGNNEVLSISRGVEARMRGVCSLCAAEAHRIKRVRAFGGCLGTERR